MSDKANEMKRIMQDALERAATVPHTDRSALRSIWVQMHQSLIGLLDEEKAERFGTLPEADQDRFTHDNFSFTEFVDSVARART